MKEASRRSHGAQLSFSRVLSVAARALWRTGSVLKRSLRVTVVPTARAALVVVVRRPCARRNQQTQREVRGVRCVKQTARSPPQRRACLCAGVAPLGYTPGERPGRRRPPATRRKGPLSFKRHYGDAAHLRWPPCAARYNFVHVSPLPRRWGTRAPAPASA